MTGFVLALGVDALLRWALRLLVGLAVVGLMVALILIQTVASVLTGGRPAAGATGSAPGLVTPVPSIGLPTRKSSPVLPDDVGASIVRAAQAWQGVPCVFGGCSRAGIGLQLPGPERLRLTGY